MQRSNMPFIKKPLPPLKRWPWGRWWVLALLLGAPVGMAWGQMASITYNPASIGCGPGLVTATAQVNGNPPGGGLEPNTWLYAWYQVASNGSETPIGANPNSKVNHLGTIHQSTQVRVRITDALGLLSAPVVANTTITPGTPPGQPIAQVNSCGASVTLTGALSGESYRLVIEENEQGNWTAVATYNNGTGVFNGTSLGFDPLSSLVRYQAYKVKNGTCVGPAKLLTAPTFSLGNYSIGVPATIFCGDNVTLNLNLNGTPASHFSEYLWTVTGLGNFTTSSPTLTLSQVSAGTKTVSVRLRDATTGCLSQGFVSPSSFTPQLAPNPLTLSDVSLHRCGTELRVIHPQPGTTYHLMADTFDNDGNYQHSTTATSTSGVFTGLPGAQFNPVYRLRVEQVPTCISTNLFITPSTLPALNNPGVNCLHQLTTVQIPALPASITHFDWKRQKTGSATIVTEAGTLGTLSHQFLLDGDYEIWVEATDDQGSGCIMATPKLTIQATPAPAAPSFSTQLASVCHGGKALIRASGANMNESYHWYKASSTGAPTALSAPQNNAHNGSGAIQMGSTWLLTEALTAPATYYVAIVGANGCEGPKTTIQVDARSPLPQPTLVAAPLGMQKAGNQTLQVSGATGSQQYVWSIGSIHSQIIQTGTSATYTAHFECTQVLYVALKDPASGCVGDRLAIPVRVFSNYSHLTEDSLNVVAEQTVRVKVTQPTALDALSVTAGQTLWTKTYLDGMGRPIQSINQQASPNGRDVVQAIVYDELGRTPLAHLPYTSATHPQSFKPNVWNEVAQFYDTTGTTGTTDHATTAYPYRFTQLEASPLNRAVVQYAPGEHWVGAQKGVATWVRTNPDPNQSSTTYSDKIRVLKVHSNPASADIVAPEQEILYLNQLENGVTNYRARNKVVLMEGMTVTTNDPTITLEVNSGDQNAPVVAGFYLPGELVRTTLTDEDGKVTEEFQNKSGQVVLKRAKVNATTWAQTYYAYDDFGQLSFVLPPRR